MSNRQLAQAFQQFSREARRLYRTLNRKLIDWLLRSALVSSRRGQNPVAGFVLPTTMLLLLVVTLTVGAITLRAVDRNTQVIANTQQKVIYNAATPAIDRARAKIEFLFDPSRDTRYPGGTPTESAYILPGMLNSGKGGLVKLPAPEPGYPNDDVYTLPGETRLDIGGRNIGAGAGAILKTDPDNAWYYRTDTDGDGKDDATVVYSILFQTPSDVTTPPAGGSGTGVTTVGSERLLSLRDDEKARDLLVRNAPISNDAKLSGCSTSATGGAASIQDGWFQDKSSSSKIRKNFQVDALVIPDNPKAAAVTIEFQQDRQLDKGNKWGAWFRYDLEVFPGPKFNWNGAMHTEGSFIPGGGNFEAYLVSAEKSCLFQKDSSEISITRLKPDDEKDQSDLTAAAKADGKTFVGQLVMAKIANNQETGSAVFHYHNRTDETKYGAAVTVNRGNDSAVDAVSYAQIISDPVAILLNEQYQSRGTSAGNRSSDAWNGFRNTDPGLRIRDNREKLPYVDDLYRADDRWGPKPKYDSEPDGRIPSGKQSGEEMDKVVNARLMNPGKPGESSAAVGLDGYWERRARIDGMRILVGERLELGDIGGWETPRDVDGNSYTTPPDKDGKPTLVDNASSFVVNATGAVVAGAIKAEERAGDSLYPPTVKPYPVAQGKLLDHRMQARRTLRDNLPAVQSAAIYHAGINAPIPDGKDKDGKDKFDVDYPVACLSMTSHPGNVHTLRNSINFMPTFFAGGNLQANFFTGQGTNGWEFEPPAKDYDAFKAAVTNKTSPLRLALDNLANFAGDPDGAFPPKQEDTENLIHPYPALTMWGNYSNLRRALKNLDAVTYSNLSVADRTYIQTAACTLGMLAYNVDRVQSFNVTDPANDGQFGDSSSNFLMEKLAVDLVDLMDGYVGNGEVLPKAKLKTYKYDPAQNDIGGDSPFASDYDPADYYEVPPEAYIAALKQKYAIENADDPLSNARVRLAEMIMLKHQIRRDRTFGFRSSPAFGEYAVTKMGQKNVAGLTYGGGSSANLLVFPSACDPDLFVFQDSIFGNRRQQRVPFDASGNLKPMLAANAANATDPTTPGSVVSSDVSKNLVQYRVALSRLCGTLDVSNYRNDSGDARGNVGLASLGLPTSNSNAHDPKRKATVKPMFPALYYLFPEVEHTLQGALRAGSVQVLNNTGATVSQDAEIADEPDAYDHRQPGTFAADATNAERIAVKAGLHPKDKESYVVDSYIGKINTAVTFKPVDTAPPTRIDLGNKIYSYTSNTVRNPVSISAVDDAEALNNLARRPYLGSAYPVADLSVAGVAIQPRSIDQWQLPIIDPQNSTAAGKEDVSTNTIFVPRDALAPNMNRTNGVPKAVPFLDRAIYDGRQDMMVRVTDIDLGMLRQTKPKKLEGLTSYQNLTDKTGQNEVWLPMSGIVYAFREDAVREDGIARKARAITPNIAELEKGTSMNQTDLANPVDSQVIKSSYGISLKPIDFLPDPDRRVHGFRLRNGVSIDRPTDKIGSLKPADNIRGLSFFTDQPVYMEGDFNLHENAAGGRLEEFTTPLLANWSNFYARTTLDPDFAKPDKDRWRPSEILADAIDVLSNDFCDGSLSDAFMPNTPPDGTIPATNYITGFPDFNSTQTADTDVNRTRYQSLARGGLFGGTGCRNNGKTSFQNQMGPTDAATRPGNSWDWMRENSAMPVSPKLKQSWQDFTTPIRISRTGDAFIINRPAKDTVNATLAGTLPDNKRQGDFRPVRYELDGGLRYASRLDGGYPRMQAAPTEINSIVVGGIQPSRANQSYGGLHNFPRFLESWGSGTSFNFSGSFIQLNFSNYATGGYEKEGMEPIAVTDSGGAVPVGASGSELIPYYSPPNRVWGYDVALQFAPAGPAAARFVTPSSTRSEFYTEPPRTDPYIRQLCVAGKAVAPAKQFNCP